MAFITRSETPCHVPCTTPLISDVAQVLDAPTATIPIDAAFLTSSAPPGTFHTPSVLLAPPALLPYKTGAAGLTFRSTLLYFAAV